MSAQHTPGPWCVQRWSDTEALVYGPKIQQGPAKGQNCHVTINRSPSSDMVADVCSNADAHLIAAAPDLLEALENLLAVSEGQGGTKYHAQDIPRAAITKAKGETA